MLKPHQALDNQSQFLVPNYTAWWRAHVC